MKGETMKLGKLPAIYDPSIRHLGAYMTAQQSPVPNCLDNFNKVMDWGLYENDRIGDCTCVAAANLIKLWTSLVGTEISLTTQDVLSAYEKISGYNGTPQTDHGAAEIRVLNYWRNTGIGNHKIQSFVLIEPRNLYQVKLAISLFGAVYVGVLLPISAKNQEIWASAPGFEGTPGSWGGHAVISGKYDDNYIECVTWGSTKRMTWDFWTTYVDECYAVLSTDWFTATYESPNHLKWDVLLEDLQKDFC
jgi:hypothetical protein